jgi:DNA-binding response OmpR family regulator
MLRPTRILLVDDDEDATELLRVLLARRGFDVSSARSVATALAAAEPASTDVLVIDLGLPDGSGHDLLRRLRRARRVPAVALSGSGRATDLAAARDAGFDEYLTKPVAIDVLAAALRRLSGR